MAFVRPSGGLGLRPKNLPGAPPLDSLNPRREGVQKLKLLDPEKGDPCRSVKGLSRHILPHPKTGDGVRYSTIPLTPLPLSGERGAKLWNRDYVRYPGRFAFRKVKGKMHPFGALDFPKSPPPTLAAR
jgi:hypothetical protein